MRAWRQPHRGGASMRGVEPNLPLFSPLPTSEGALAPFVVPPSPVTNCSIPAARLGPRAGATVAEWTLIAAKRNVELAVLTRVVVV